MTVLLGLLLAPTGVKGQLAVATGPPALPPMHPVMLPDGGATTENSRSGFRREVPNDKAQRWVDRLHESGTGHWHVVPASELVKP